MPQPYASVAADTFIESDARSDRLMRLLAEPSELVALVLRGHLVLEELLFAACAAHCQDVEQLKSARLRFPQLVSLLRALEKIPAAPPHYWEALLKFNILRNALAHRLEPSDIDEQVRQLRLLLRSSLPVPGGNESELTSFEQLKQVIYFLVGGFDVVTVWQQAVQFLIADRLQTAGPENAA